MKSDVLRRLGTLEQRVAPQERMVIWRTIVRPGPNGPEEVEPVAVKNLTGWSLARLAGESVSAFRIRAEANAPTNDRGVAVIYEIGEEQAACAS